MAAKLILGHNIPLEHGDLILKGLTVKKNTGFHYREDGAIIPDKPGQYQLEIYMALKGGETPVSVNYFLLGGEKLEVKVIDIGTGSLGGESKFAYTHCKVLVIQKAPQCFGIGVFSSGIGGSIVKKQTKIKIKKLPLSSFYFFFMARVKHNPTKMLTGNTDSIAVVDVYKKPRKPRRLKPGTRALKEIKKYQKGNSLIIPKAPFQRLVRELTQKLFVDKEYRYQKPAMDAIQEACEAYVIGILEDCQLAAVHSKRITIKPKDIVLSSRMRNK